MTDVPRSSPRVWLAACAACWLCAFLLLALTLELPNNRPVRRWDLLTLSPTLVDLVAPLPIPDESPEARYVRENSGWKTFPQRLDLLLVAGTILAGAWGLGGLGLRLLRVDLSGVPAERTMLACGLGLSGLSLLTLGAGLCGWLSRPLLGTIVAGAPVLELALRILRRYRPRSVPRPNQPPSLSQPQVGESDGKHNRLRGRGGRWLFLIVVTPFLLAMLLGSLLPSVDFDVNEYHFLGPKEFFQNGRITFLPHNVYTSFPFGTEMLTLLAMVLRDDWFRGALAGKCLLMSLAPLTALGLYAAGRRWFGEGAGLLAAGLHLTTPWVYRIASIGNAEGGLTFFLFAALFAGWRALERSPSGRDAAEPQTGSGLCASPEPSRWPRFLLAGLMAGSALACKYPGAVSVVLPLLGAVLWKTSRRKAQAAIGEQGSSPRALVPAACFVAGVLLAVGPWLLKNLLETGNPVYPLLYTIFGGADWDADLNARWRAGHSPRNFAIFSLEPGAMGLLYSVVDVAARNDWVNPLLFGCAGLTWFSADLRRRTCGLWLYVLWLFATWWLLTHRIDRFWTPIIPVLALLAGAGGSWLWNAGNAVAAPLLRGALVVCLTTMTVTNLFLVTSRLGGYNNFLLDLDAARQLALHATAPEIEFLNARLPQGAKVLAVGDAELFEAQFPVVYNTVFDRSILEKWCAEPTASVASPTRRLRDPAEIRQRLAAEGITHIYVNWHEVLRYRAPGSYGYTDFVSPRSFDALRKADVLGPAWEIPEALSNVARLDALWQDELRRFAPELIVRAGGVEMFPAFQVFDVQRDAALPE